MNAPLGNNLKFSPLALNGLKRCLEKCQNCLLHNIWKDIKRPNKKQQIHKFELMKLLWASNIVKQIVRPHFPHSFIHILLNKLWLGNEIRKIEFKVIRCICSLMSNCEYVFDWIGMWKLYSWKIYITDLLVFLFLGTYYIYLCHS